MPNSTGNRPYRAVITLVLALLACGVAAKVSAQGQIPIDIDKLQKAQRLAERVFDETGNAAGAVNVLEEAGITKLVGDRTPAVPRTIRAGLLETYGGLLAYLPEHRRDAAAILKAVIESEPERASAYFHLGNLYYQLHRQEPDDSSYIAVYSAAYRKYVDRLRKQKQRVLLFSPIVEAAYEDGLDICGFLGLLQQRRQLADLNLFFNPETEPVNLSQIEAAAEDMPVASFSSFISGSAGVIRRTLIDVDNDGRPETRYSAAAATGDCRRNVFYRHDDEQSRLLSNDLLDDYYRPDRLCSGGRIAFVNYMQQNYLLELRPLQEDIWKTTVYRLTPAGGYLQLCGIEPPSAARGGITED